MCCDNTNLTSLIFMVSLRALSSIVASFVALQEAAIHGSGIFNGCDGKQYMIEQSICMVHGCNLSSVIVNPKRLQE